MSEEEIDGAGCSAGENGSGKRHKQSRSLKWFGHSKNRGWNTRFPQKGEGGPKTSRRSQDRTRGWKQKKQKPQMVRAQAKQRVEHEIPAEGRGWPKNEQTKPGPHEGVEAKEQRKPQSQNRDFQCANRDVMLFDTYDHVFVCLRGCTMHTEREPTEQAQKEDNSSTARLHILESKHAKMRHTLD